MRRVIIESPFAGNVGRNLRYLRACMRDCLLRGEAPFASHGLYPQPGVLDDDNPTDRELGINAGFEWRASAEATIFYTDLGFTTGMVYGIRAALALHDEDPDHAIEFRTLDPVWETTPEYRTRWE